MFHLGGEIEGELGGGNGMIFGFHVMGEGISNGLGIEHAGLVGLPEIKEVATFSALIESAEFGAEDFGGGVDGQRVGERSCGGRCHHGKEVAR